MKKYVAIGIFIIVLFSIVFLINMPDNKLHIIFCDVGQGDGIIIKTPESKQIIIDGGPDDSIQECISKYIPFYDTSINIMMISHFHADHISGFISLLQSYTTDMLIKDEVSYNNPEKKELGDQINKSRKKIQIEEVWQGDEIQIEKDLSLEILWPRKDSWNTSNGNWEAYLNDFNDTSIVALLKYRDFFCLLTGDVGKDILDNLANKINIPEASTRILKQPHHGSEDGVSETLLNKFKPQYSIISSGAKNKFGHPHKTTIESLNNHNIQILRTDQSGDIEFVSNGLSLWLKE